MDKQSKNKTNRFSAMTNVEKMHDMLIPEEFPEGTYGSPVNQHEKVEGKSTEWGKGQQRTSAFKYIDKETQDDRTRKGPAPDHSLDHE